MSQPAVSVSSRLSVLDVVARRIRSLRALRGISRRILSERSGVSLRHLAQIEQGNGNVSIKLLEQISDALGVSPADVLVEAQTADHAALFELIGQMDAEACRQAARLLRRELAPARQSHISLIGLRGAGKTTLGSRLAEDRGLPFVSVTALIEANAGMPVAEINSLSGQTGYRVLEREAVEQALAREEHSVIEAGGSIVSNAPAFSELLASTFSIWIQAAPEEHLTRVVEQGDLRPLEGRSDAIDDLIAMLDERKPMYSQAHARLDTTGLDIEASYARLKEITTSHDLSI